ncbi:MULTISPECIES: long-chain fatty acid--CoA ligase [unclassified Fusibacter]|uniref:long-chain-fatty-acid--CoA ligase n=1 Tax=unclassified Fusibacter TaxID=2624464 RepID=UPI0010125548|nr:MULTISPECIES: long-chain fatty acid--CoA ligase [unclassified Fusibacter]MCK8058868.1 long-chain fatty acid--CoA ligase [Fusibacter sp. A2]NPE21943.1 long-chain fatty acid--CoA ligase [Fusibacter sp. A1]RXV61511.1 long-chain fatty acid--CoA ligase [Fusibacter sp. A1]
MLVHQLLQDHNDHAIALRYHGEAITYKTLRQKIGSTRSYLESIGVKRGDHVGLYCKNSPEFIYAYFAVVSMGAVIIPFNRTLTASEVDYIAKDAQIKLLITMESLGISDEFRQELIPEYSKLLSSDEFSLFDDAPQISEEDVAVIIYTSGTTGHPKGAMLTHRNLVSNTKGIVKALDVTSEDKFLCVLPMFHSFAWTTSVLAALYNGALIAIMENFHPKDALKMIRTEGLSVVCGVPTMYNYYLMLGTPETFVSMRVFVSGGASLPVEVMTNFSAKFGIPIVEGYGLSEASPVVSVNPMDKVKVGSIGKPIEEVFVKIVDAQHMEVARGTVGELAVKGPNVMKGYYNLKEVTDQTIEDDWLYTGDLAKIDDEGYIHIVDRLKDIVIVSGMNVYPREIEEVIYRYEGIIEATVIGISDKTRGEVPIAYIVTSDNSKFDEKAFKSFLKQNLASFKLPKKIRMMDALPKNATGKVMKKTLRDSLL